MHEVSLMESAIHLALDYASREHARKIHRVKMRVGVLSGVMPEALEFAFDMVTQGTIAEGATFEIESVSAVCFCEKCQREFRPDGPFYECPTCRQLSAEIRQGKELELTSLEVS
jgi:hydrogenase nickel incorporation protein HypA/HybF